MVNRGGGDRRNWPIERRTGPIGGRIQPTAEYWANKGEEGLANRGKRHCPTGKGIEPTGGRRD